MIDQCNLTAGKIDFAKRDFFQKQENVVNYFAVFGIKLRYDLGTIPHIMVFEIVEMVSFI